MHSKSEETSISLPYFLLNLTMTAMVEIQQEHCWMWRIMSGAKWSLLYQSNVIFINSLILYPLLLKRGSSSCWIVSKLWVFRRRWGHTSDKQPVYHRASQVMLLSGAISASLWSCVFRPHVTASTNTWRSERVSRHVLMVLMQPFANHLEHHVAFSPTSSKKHWVHPKSIYRVAFKSH